MTQKLFAADALLSEGWARNVLLAWDDEGRLTQVQAGAQRPVVKVGSTRHSVRSRASRSLSAMVSRSMRPGAAARVTGPPLLEGRNSGYKW